MKDVAVFLIDMQTTFVCRLEKTVREKVLKAQVSLLEACVERNIPVFVFEYNDEGETVPVLKEVLARVPRTLTLTKVHDNGFSATSLNKHLLCLGIRTVVLAGMNAGACVRDTAKSAQTHGYRVVTSPDLIADSETDGLRDDSLRWYVRNGCFSASPLESAAA